MGERRQLIDLAYRLLGSLAEAEDVVQETFARWYSMSRQQREAIESPGAWLMAFDVAGDRINHIWAVRNPDKLRPWTAG